MWAKRCLTERQQQLAPSGLPISKVVRCIQRESFGKEGKCEFDEGRAAKNRCGAPSEGHNTVAAAFVGIKPVEADVDDRDATDIVQQPPLEQQGQHCRRAIRKNELRGRDEVAVLGSSPPLRRESPRANTNRATN